MLDVRVNSSVRNEAEQMKSRAVRGRSLHRVDDGGLLLELVLFDACMSGDEKKESPKLTLVNLDNVLPDDSTGSDVEVTEGKPVVAEGLKSTDPTSELPISPSLRPTARPCASSSTKLCLSRTASMCVVSPWKIAFPFSLSDNPQPS